MSIDKILATLLLIGSDLPAFKALWAEVVVMFGADDQAALKDAYARAMVEATKAHEEAQRL